MKPPPVHEPRSQFLRLALISSSHAMRTGLKVTLKAHPSIAISDDASTGAKAVEIIARDKPQVIIVDLELSDADPLALIRKLRAAAAGSHILVLSGLNDAKLTLKALAAGAEGVVLTIQPPAVLVAAIESLSGCASMPWGDRSAQSVNGQIGDRPSARIDDLKHSRVFDCLTSREGDIVHLIAKGLTNKDIAERLCISETTVRHHLTAIYSKLQVSTRQKLLIRAHQQGLVEFGGPVDGRPASFPVPA